MNVLDGLVLGLSVAFTMQNLLAAVLGAAIGTMVGVLPGLGPVGAMALLLPVSVAFEPTTAIILLAGIYYGSMYGGSTTSILVHIPGEAASIVTMRDGYAMAQRGRAGAALAVAAVGSFVAGTLALFGLVFFTPVLSDFALRFGPPEYFAIALVGLIALSRLSSKSSWKALVMMALGLAIGTVGTDAVTGTARFDFGSLQASGGLNLVPIVIGLFGFAEVLQVAERRGGLPRIAAVKFRQLFGDRQLWRRAAKPILRGSGLGFLIGLIPGPANVISSFASYNLERRLAKHPEEFGHGAVEGVAGPESANNAATSGQLIPLLGLGIPFSAAAGLLLAALTLQGVQPGPLLLQDHPDVFWGVVASMLVGNVALLIFNLPMVGVWVSMLRLPEGLLVTIITVLVLIGAFTLRNSFFDVTVMIVAGVVGYVLRKLDFDMAPLILAIILGPFLETSFRQSLFLAQGDLSVFVTRPISATLLGLLVVGLVVTALLRSRVTRMSRGDVDPDPIPSNSPETPMLIGRYRIDGHRTYGVLEPETGTVQPVTDPFLGAPRPQGDPVEVGAAEQLPPTDPSIIVAAAVNYISHAIKRSPTDRPELFFKPPSSVIGPGEHILLPADAGTVEAEGELVVVIGRTARNVSPERAAAYILGYTCGVDVSARDWQRADRQFWRAKGCDTFSPVGPVIATGIDPAECSLTTKVNGETKQHTSVSELLFGVGELVAFASRHLTLRPGDLIFTGTPGTTPRITPGDVVDVTISGVGSLVNPVATDETTTIEGAVT